MKEIILKIDDKGNGFAEEVDGLFLGRIYWDWRKETYIFMPYPISLDCDQLAELSRKIGHANSYDYPKNKDD